MNQLEWGSDLRAFHSVADCRRHGELAQLDVRSQRAQSRPCRSPPRADVQGLLTMLFTGWLSGGNPPLFMDFRKVWEPWEIQGLARSLGVPFTGDELWAREGLFVDGDNSGSASFDWAGRPGDSVEKIMSNVSMPGRRAVLLPRRRQQRVVHQRPAASRASRAAWPTAICPGMFSLVWDEATTVELPAKLSGLPFRGRRTSRGRTRGSCRSTPRWPSTSSMRPAKPLPRPSGAWRPAGCNTGWIWPTSCRWLHGRGVPSGCRKWIARSPLLYLLNWRRGQRQAVAGRSAKITRVRGTGPFFGLKTMTLRRIAGRKHGPGPLGPCKD